MKAWGPVLRIACWNIERGFNFDLIRLAFSDAEGFQQTALEHGALDPKKLPAIQKQLQSLRDADVIVLNEADFGMKRTDYRDVAKELAHVLNMNYVFGVEFVEVDRLDDLGIDSCAIGRFRAGKADAGGVESGPCTLPGPPRQCNPQPLSNQTRSDLPASRLPRLVFNGESRDLAA